MELNFATAWEALSDEIHDAHAIACGDHVFSWAQYEKRAARVAEGLAGAGIAAGANVGLCLYNGPEYSEA